MNVNIELNATLRGRFNLIVRDAETLEVKRETGWFDNLVLNAGLNRYGSGGVMTHCQVGTSNVAPEETQTALSAYLATASSILTDAPSVQAVAPYYGKLVRTYRFNAGVATGTLAEVGVGWTAASGSLFSRALILDLDGNPTTITVLPDEILDVVYELRQYPDLLDKVFVANISGVDYNCVLRASRVTALYWYWKLQDQFSASSDLIGGSAIAFNGALNGITSAPSGTSSNANVNPSLGAYVNNSHQRTITYSWGLDAGNVAGGITAIEAFSTKGAYKISFAPGIPKDNTKTFNITIRFAWARYTP